MKLSQFTIYWCDLEPTYGRQIRKTRPCAVVSPSEVNDIMGTVIVVPLTSTARQLPFYLPVQYAGRIGALACDQIKTIDKRRVGDEFAKMTTADAKLLADMLGNLFSDSDEK